MVALSKKGWQQPRAKDQLMMVLYSICKPENCTLLPLSGYQLTSSMTPTSCVTLRLVAILYPLNSVKMISCTTGSGPWESTSFWKQWKPRIPWKEPKCEDQRFLKQHRQNEDPATRRIRSYQWPFLDAEAQGELMALGSKKNECLPYPLDHLSRIKFSPTMWSSVMEFLSSLQKVIKRNYMLMNQANLVTFTYTSSFYNRWSGIFLGTTRRLTIGSEFWEDTQWWSFWSPRCHAFWFDLWQFRTDFAIIIIEQDHSFTKSNFPSHVRRSGVTKRKYHQP